MYWFLATNTYYHQVVKEKNDAKNVNIAKDIVHYIETAKPEDLNNYLKTLGEIGYQIYVTSGEEGYFLVETIVIKHCQHLLLTAFYKEKPIMVCETSLKKPL